MRFTKEQIGVSVTRAELISFLNDQLKGGFAYAHHYRSVETGEVSNQWFKAACSYERLTVRSIRMIDDGSLLAKVTSDGLEVIRGTWLDDEGIQHSHRAADRVHQTIRKVYSMTDPGDAAMINLAISDIRAGFVAPKPVRLGFTTVAQGTYTKVNEAPGIIYLKDCLFVSKIVVKPGDCKPTASDEMPAIRDALTALLPRGRYICLKLAGNFDYVSIGGQALLQGSDPGKWDISLALKEDVKIEAPVIVESVPVTPLPLQ